MDEDGLWRMVRAEWEDIIAFLSGLAPPQWRSPSLCEGWRVKDVAVHLLVDEPFRELGWTRAIVKLASVGFSVHRANAWWIERNAAREPASILEAMRRSLSPGRVARLLGPGSGLRAGIIHHQDMRRPLGMAREIPADRLRCALDAVLTPKGSVNLGARARAEGLRLRATDIDWVRGEGPEVRGPGEAILMSLAGRAVALAELAGEGREALAGRCHAAWRGGAVD